MDILKLRKNLVSVALGAALGIGMTTQAMAAPGVFTFDPQGISPTNPAAFQATSIGMVTSELLTLTSPTTLSGQGWGIVTSFNNGSVPLFPSTTGLNTEYGLYILFNLTASGPAGTLGTAGSVQTLDSLNFQVYETTNGAELAGFTPASINGAGDGVAPTPNAPGGGDILLGTGSYLMGTAGFDSNDGAYLNSTESFSLTTPAMTGSSIAGTTLFTDPIPFFNLAFDEFNNTAQGVAFSTAGAPSIAINDASGTVDFNVPEPASIALFGLGLIGLTFLRRKSS